jgi:hypothetical protein
VAAPADLRDFAKLAPEVEAVLQRIGDGMWDLLLVSVDGTWVREVVASEEAAEALCAELGLRLYRGWGDPRIARRMNRRDHWGEPGGQRRAV